MKVRMGFVSNSSSCSFTCEVCGVQEGGYDSVSMLEYGFVYCENHHELCLDCLTDKYISSEPIEKDYKTTVEFEEAYKKWEDTTDYDDIVPESVCPICQFIEPSQKDMAKYLEKMYGTSRDEVFSEVKKCNKRRKKLYDFEYITHVCQKHDVKLDYLLPKLKNEFKTYGNFRQFLRGE